MQERAIAKSNGSLQEKIDTVPAPPLSPVVTETGSLSSFGLLLMLAIVVLAACGGGPPASVRAPQRVQAPSPLIRVGLQLAQTSVRLSGTGRFQVSDRPTGTVIGEADRGLIWEVAPIASKVEAFGPDAVSRGRYTGPLLIKPLKDGGRVWVGGREFRGAIEIKLDAQGKLSVINEIELEQYLRGVVPAEIGRLDENRIEAAKAQAVAARTYVFAHLGRRKALGFDLFATVDDQVYRGFAIESPTTNKAVEETRGLVAAYKGKLIEAYYSSTCGGHTESIEDGWLGDPSPYLTDVKDKGRGGGDFCTSSPFYRWTETWDRVTLERILANAIGVFTGNKEEDLELKDIRIRKRSKSGRAHILEIKTAKGTNRFEGDKIRSVLRRPADGTPALRSTFFLLKIKRDSRGRPETIVAKGAGYGHGIGMCQVGAIVMASRGYRFDQILKHYYRGITVQRNY